MKKRILGGLLGLAMGTALSLPATAVELDMYYPIQVGGPLAKIMEGLVADFQKEYPGITVKPIYSGNYSETMAKTMTAIKGGNAPDLAVLLSVNIYPLIDNDAIVAIQDLAKTAEDKAWLQSFWPAFMLNSQTEGKIWSVPFQRSTGVLYYNKEMLKAVGVDPEVPPKTWDEMVAYGKKAVKRDAAGNILRWGIEIPSTAAPFWLFGGMAIQNGVNLMNQAGTETYFNDPKVVEALDWWVSLSQKHEVMPKGLIEWGTLRQDFLEQKTAMIWHSTGNLASVKKGAKFDFGVALLPGKVRQGSPTGGGNFYIFKSTTGEKRAAAYKFVKWMSQPERAAEWSIKTGYVGTSPASYETKALREYVASFPPASVGRDQLALAKAELSTHESERIVKILNDAIQAALTGKKTAQESLDDAQKKADRVLKRFR
ncbi:MAG: ABC transporter substrate-binding protein [Rhodospirillales bacterium]|nr:ABC transporter substrate-binding protein [Rhodospirillales bacterium]